MHAAYLPHNGTHGARGERVTQGSPVESNRRAKVTENSRLEAERKKQKKKRKRKRTRKKILKVQKQAD